MAERGTYQLSFSDIPVQHEPDEPANGHDPGATHIIYRGARIRVKSKHNHSYAWATVETSEFDAAQQEKSAEPHHEPSMRYYLAMSAFSVFYVQHQSVVSYEAGTPFYAYSPSNKYPLVARIPKKRHCEKVRRGL